VLFLKDARTCWGSALGRVKKTGKFLLVSLVLSILWLEFFSSLFARHKIPFAQIMQIERNSFLLLRNEEAGGMGESVIADMICSLMRRKTE
jgi:hypothetical protein